MDGADEFFPAHRRADQFRVGDGRHDASFHLCGDHRRELRRLVSARCARFRIQHGMGRGLCMVVVVLRPVDDSADLARKRLDWSYQRGSMLFGSLVGHIIYGLIVGLIYAALDKLWIGFFKESDPINREPEGPGSRVLHSLGYGALASLVGGLLFTVVLLVIGVLPT